MCINAGLSLNDSRRIKYLAPYQLPTFWSAGICPTHHKSVIDFLNDSDEIVTLTLCRRKEHIRTIRMLEC